MCVCLYNTHNHVFPDNQDESCYRDTDCPYMMKCVDETCKCPPSTYHVSFTVDTDHVHRCIPNGGTFAFNNKHV